ncbi:translocation/assembly module TamB domain-containing protein [Thermomonas paludicola]|uniref:translocation/assembly module TamB domain-containing protein n=1 Tax=Thermomonas paludicola TaxID=2884874 RepID=UPI002114256C|nr:translocation/assembly module TamB domain-containing protein [Thermomonas paludicola]
MSLRERYQRYRRHGLQPLPADASSEQREARIAELRMLRRKRRRKIALRGGIAIALVTCAIAVLAYWLLTTIGGRDALLRQIVARLPAGTELRWKSAEGPVSGPLLLRGVHFSMPRQRDPDCVPSDRASCAMGRIVFDADTVLVDPALRPLLGRTLRLDALAIAGATLDLPHDATPFKLPRWPDVLPQIAPPLALQADTLRIDGLRVVQEGEPLIDIQRVRGGLDAGNGRLHVEHVRIDSDRGRFAVHGDYAPRDNFRSDVIASAVLPAPAGRTPARLGLVVRGDLANMVVAIGGTAPAPLHATLTLRGKDAPRWQLRAGSAALDIGLLTGGDAASLPLAFTLQGDGVAGNATLQGKVEQGGFSAILLPSRLSLEDQVLRLHPLVVETSGGRISAQGDADLRDARHASVNLTLAARGLRWTSADGATAIAADADLGLAGKLEQWSLKGQARLQRGRGNTDERAVLDLIGSGNRDGLRLEVLHVAMAQGQLAGSGRVAWSPALAWQATATLAGFDPGYFAPDWPGAIKGTLHSHGQRRQDGSLQARVEATSLGGTLRGRALSGRAALEVDGNRYSGDVALALGESRIEATGTVAANIDVDARVSPLRLDDLLPAGKGSLRGTLRLRGPRNAPDVAVDLAGSGLAFGDYRAATLQASGTLPWQRGHGSLRIDAADVQAGVPLTHLHASLTGAVEDLQFDVGAAGDPGALAVRGDARKQGTRWQGRLRQLTLQPTRGAAWTLQQPAQWAWDGRSGTLSQACLQSGIGGALCASGDWPRRGIDLRGNGLPLALANAWLPARDDGRPWLLDGNANVLAQVRPQGTAWRATATLESASGGIRDRARARRNLFGFRDLVASATLDPQRIEATVGAALDRDGRIDARLATGWDAYAPLTGALKASIRELTWLELFSPDIVEPAGKLDLDVRLAGTRARPLLGGTGQLSEFATELPALGIAVQGGDLRLQALNDGSALIDGSLGTGKGLLRVEGSLGWQDDATPLQLRLHGSDVLLADTRQVRILASPDIRLSYRAGAPLQLRGNIGVPEADLHLERLDMGVSPSPDVVVLDPADPTQAATPLALDLDVVVALGNRVQLDGYGLTGTLGGSLRVLQPPGRDLRATGVLAVGGRYRAYGQDLRITTGKLIWSNAIAGDPLLDIRAQREVGAVTVGVQVNGRASAPQVSVWSMPAMSQSEALAYLTLGRPLPSLSSRELQQLDVAKSALNAGVGLLTAKLGARIGLDDAGVSTSRALGAEVLGVGKYISPKLYVSYGVSLLGTGQVVTLKYLLRKGFDIQIESSTVENRASVNWRKEK